MMNGYGMGAGGWILMTVFWVLLVVVIIWAVTQLFPRDGTAPRERETAAPTDARAILDARLARGEIDIDTYDEIRAKLDEPAHEPYSVGG